MTRLFLIVPCLLCLWEARGAVETPQFRDVTQESGIQGKTLCGNPEKKYIVSGNGSGCAWIDYDQDGWMDLYIVNGIDLRNLFEGREDPSRHPNRFFRNEGDGTFTEISESTGTWGTGLGNGVATGDVNNDGEIDLFVTNYGRDLLYVNQGDGSFREEAESYGIGGGRFWSTGASFGDYDRDGWLDLYVVRYLEFDTEDPPLEGEFCVFRGLPVMCGPSGLPAAKDVLYRNNGDGSFSDVTSKVGVAVPTPRYGFAVAFEDLDNDGWLDLFVTNDSGPNFLFHNQGDGTFQETALLAGIAYNQEGRAQANMGLAMGELFERGWSDIFITTFSEDYYPLFENLGGISFREVTTPAGIGTTRTFPYLGWATFFFDYDNDGRLDLFMANGHLYPEADQLPGRRYAQPNLLFRGVGRGLLAEVEDAAHLNAFGHRSSRAAAYADYDNDGDLDLLELAIDEEPRLFRNDGGHLRNWFQIELDAGRNGGSLLGARIEVDVAGRTQTRRIRSGANYLSQNQLRAHFGLGGADRVDAIRVFWADGTQTELTEPREANQLVRIRYSP